MILQPASAESCADDGRFPVGFARRPMSDARDRAGNLRFDPAEAPQGPRPRDETVARLVLAASATLLADPMHQDHIAAGPQRRHDLLGQGDDIRLAEIIDHLGQDDEIESSVRPLPRHEHRRKPDPRRRGVAPSRFRERIVHRFDGQQVVAAAPQFSVRTPMAQPISRAWAYRGRGSAAKVAAYLARS